MDFRPNVAVDKTGLCASTKTLSKSGFIRTSFDFSIFVTEYALIIYRLTAIDHLNDGFGGIFRFLTIWNFTLQAFYFGLCLLTDLVEGEKPPGEKRGMLQQWRDVLHSVEFSISFVSCVFVLFYVVNVNCMSVFMCTFTYLDLNMTFKTW